MFFQIKLKQSRIFSKLFVVVIQHTVLQPYIINYHSLFQECLCCRQFQERPFCLRVKGDYYGTAVIPKIDIRRALCDIKINKTAKEQFRIPVFIKTMSNCHRNGKKSKKTAFENELIIYTSFSYLTSA